MKTVITDYQRNRIFALCAELGWDDDMRHDMMRFWVGKDSLSAKAPVPVTIAEAGAIIKELQKALDQVQRGRRIAKKSIDRRSPGDAQSVRQSVRLNAAAVRVFGESNGDRRAFRAWLKSHYHVDAPSFLTRQQATVVILSLERMAEQGWRPSRHTNTPASPAK